MDKQQQGRKRGLAFRIMLTVGRLLLGMALICGLLFLSVVLNPSCRSSTRSRASMAYADMRSMQVAIDSYFADQKVYPAWAAGNRGANAYLTPNHPSYSAPTFMIKTDATPAVFTLTTPIQYMISYSHDIYTRDPKGLYAYWAGDCQQDYIIYSTGPDGVYDIDPDQDFIPGSTEISAPLIQKSYDPTNGLNSPGDLWMSKNWDSGGYDTRRSN